MNTQLGHWLRGLCAAALAAGAVLPAQALSICAAPPQPESRAEAFDARLFRQDAAELSVRGQSQLSAFAQALDLAAVEVVVVSVPLPVLADAQAPRTLAQQRAEAVRRQLARHGVPRERIYVEQRATTLPAQAAQQAPVVIETIAAWPRHAALARGWRCIAQAPGGATL